VSEKLGPGYQQTMRQTLLVSSVLASQLIFGGPIGLIAKTGAAPSPQPPAEKTVTIVFPKDSLGVLYGIQSTESTSEKDHPLSRAQGTVTVPSTEKLSLHFNYAGAEHLSALQSIHCPNLLSLDLRNLDNVSDKNIEPLQNLGYIEQILLDNTDITNQGMVHLASLNKLRDLSIQGTLVTGPGLVYLSKMTSLERLGVSRLRLDDAAVAHLTPLIKLTQLKLGAVGIGDPALKVLGTMNSLEGIDISKNKRITDQGMSYLSKLKHLHNLELSDTSVTVAALPYFKQMPALRKLSLDAHNFNANTLNELRKGLPACEISVRKQRIESDVFAPMH
jgi:hypothetical protein